MIWTDDFLKETAGMGPGSRIFFNFCDFYFHGPTLGHVSGHVGTCHVDVQKMKKKGLGKLICLGTKILKIGQKLREFWP